MKAQQFFAPLRNTALMGVALLLTITLGWILGGSDPRSVRESLGIAKYYDKQNTNTVAAEARTLPHTPTRPPATIMGSTPVAKNQ